MEHVEVLDKALEEIHSMKSLYSKQDQEDHPHMYNGPSFASSAVLHDERAHTARPSVKFTFTIDPMSIEITEHRRPFYKFITSLCAIVGGVYVVFSMGDRITDMTTRIFQ